MKSLGNFFFLMATLLSSLGHAASIEKDRLILTGSSTVAPLALEIAKRFEKTHPGIRVDVQTGGSSRGVADARQGLAHIGMVSRALHTDEGDLSGHTIARDGVAILVHKSNPIASLSKEQILSIYTGKVTDWKQLGAKAGRITVVHKAAGRSTSELFNEYLGIKNTDVKAHIIIGDNEQGIKTIVGNPQAIGYVSIGTAEFQAGQGVAIKVLPLESVIASVDNVKTGKYPLARPLNLVTRNQVQGLAKEFIAFAQSPAVADLIKEQYFVPVEIER